MSNRKYVEVFVTPEDAKRLRMFIQSETNYYNKLVKAFGSRLRTMPSIFEEINEGLLVAASQGNVDRKDRSIPERHMLFLEEVSGRRDILSPETKSAMIKEMREVYSRIGSALTEAKRAVELPSIQEPRTKRHLQIPREVVKIDKQSIRIPYVAEALAYKGQLPDGWRTLVVRDQGEGAWQLEFRSEPYAVGMTDSPIRKARPVRIAAR